MIVQIGNFHTQGCFWKYFKQYIKQKGIEITGFHIMQWKSKYSPPENLFSSFEIINLVCEYTDDLLTLKSKFNQRKLTGRWLSETATPQNKQSL